MQLGFIGTGAITSAMVTGLCAPDGAGHQIRLSPRNATVAADLARRYPGVAVACSNQDVLDGCEVVVLAVRPPMARGVLAELRFRREHRVISVMAGLAQRQIAGLVAPAIKRFLADTNAHPRPFHWTKDPDKIIAAVRRGHQTLDSIH